ncbi:hypothetical protein [Acidovorax sp. FJL06]|uniref:hypothetical protein n=1 Tax=Acidovorax sp. FJL06 TaxID=2153365 RepID=UPI000F58E303|nr:hypothetical protein [Acidovorax sp. FJL06]
MQELSAYLLEANGLNQEKVTDRISAIAKSVSAWLTKKGATAPTHSSGTFESLTDNGNGRFTREHIITDNGMLEEIRLDEYSRGGQTFTTMLSVVALSSKVAVYGSLSVTNTVSVIAPVYTDPRCPTVIRDLLSSFPDWSLNGNPLGQGRSRYIKGESACEALVEQLASTERLLPVVLVSENDDEVLWPKLDNELAFDLAGLAHVVRVDEDASWFLTDELGRENSCYLGAVRLYWPTRLDQSGEPKFPGTVWTASALLSNDHDGKGFNRLRSTLRRRVMNVAALTVVPPPEMRDIKKAASRKRLQELEQRASANSDELALARLYIDENEELKSALEKSKSEIAALNARAEMAEYALAQLKSSDATTEPDLSEPQESGEPKPGEERYYKKQHSKPAYDVLIRVDGCGHTSWQSAAKADKAKKGVERLEGRNDWKNIQHCGSCTGGGMWKVRW